MEEAESNETNVSTRKVLATVSLTQRQTELSLTRALIADSQELAAAIEGKDVQVNCTWETSKWSDPNALVSFVFVEAYSEDTDEDTEEE